MKEIDYEIFCRVDRRDAPLRIFGRVFYYDIARKIMRPVLGEMSNDIYDIIANAADEVVE